MLALGPPRDLAPASGVCTRLTRPCASNTRTCHLRAGGSCTKLTALPLRVVAAAPADPAATICACTGWSTTA